MTRLVTPQRGTHFGGRRYLISIFFRLSLHCFLDFHVPELVGVEYLATIQTFDVFDVLFTRYDAYFRVFASGVHWES
jgi:hypothetical protein